MDEEPRKRLVGWTQYYGTLWVKRIGTSAGCAFQFGGYLGFALTVVFILLGLAERHLNYFGRSIGIAACCTGLGFLGFWISEKTYDKVENIEEVDLLTRHNTGQLSEVETLVRPSDVPPSHQQAELLRAAQPGHETPPEELLRATGGQDREG